MSHDVLEVLKKLPEVCYTRLPSTGETVIIKRGVVGYFPITTALTPEELNEGVSPEQVMAMEVGSMNGWHVPGADPDVCRELMAKAAARLATLRKAR